MLSYVKTTLVTIAFSAAAAVLAEGNVTSSLSGGLLTGLSTSCITSLSGLVSTNASSCLGFSGFLTDFGAVNATSSIITPAAKYLKTEICGKTSCTASAIGEVLDTLQKGCNDELKATQFNGAQLISYFVANYGRLRVGACLNPAKNAPNSCLIRAMKRVETVTKTPVSFNELGAFLTNSSAALNTLKALAADNKTRLCTDCNHALITALIPNITASEIGQGMVSVCGSSFGDGKTPSSVVQDSTVGTAATINESNSTTTTPSGSSAKTDGTPSNYAAGPYVVGVFSAIAAMVVGIALL